MTEFKRSRITAATVAAAALFSAPLTVSAQSVQITQICACYVTSLSADGSAATGLLNEISWFTPFRWTQSGGMKNLGRSTAKRLSQTAGTPAISADGRTIAATIIDDTKSFGTEGLWTVGAGWTQLAPLPPDGGQFGNFDSSVFGMSGDGKTVTGLYWLPSRFIANGSVWTAATGMVGMPSDGRSSRIDGANYDGSVLVGWDEHPSFGYRRATVWVNGVKTILDDGGPQGWGSEASYVNSNGTIIVGQSGNPDTELEEATMWTWDGSTWVRKYLGAGANSVPYYGDAYARGLSDDGTMVVGEYVTDAGLPSHGFVWTEATGLVDAQDWITSQGGKIKKNLSVHFVSSITPDGRVLGMVAYQNSQPYQQRSLLVTRLDAAKSK